MAPSDPTEETLFHAAQQLTDPAEQRAYLDRACAGRPELRRRLERLLGVSGQADAFFGRQGAPVAGLANKGVGVGTVATQLSEGPATRIDRYKLLQQIGEGGMGVVYMAEQEEPVRRRVALKIIKLGMDTRQVVARFEAERQALALMDHPNIARVLDGGATETGRPYFVMELVQGVPITEFCDRNKLPARERLKLLIPVCQAIQSAHQKGIIHRDIKPSNVLVTLHHGEPMPKVIDFGIAKATNQKLTEKTLFTNYAMMISTPAYMSPEQAEMSSLDVDTRTDVYALGVLLYELLTGTTPFPEQRLRSLGYGEMQRVILEEEPERPSTRLSTMDQEAKSAVARTHGEELAALSRMFQGDLDWIVMKCLEKDRTRRYETAASLAMDLQRHLSNEPVVARPPSRLYEFEKAVRRHKVGFASAVAVVLALALGVIVSAWQAARATRARDEAKVNELEAERARANEVEARRRAEAEKERARLAEAGSREQVLRLSVANGVRLLDEGDPTGALLWFARSLSLEQGDAEREKPHRLRYASTLQQGPRLVHLLEGAENYAAFSPDGRSILTTHDDGAGRVYDAATEEPIVPLLQHPGQASGAANRVWYGAFSPDSTRVVTCAMDQTARIWDARTGQPIGSPLQHGNWVVHAEFSPDIVHAEFSPDSQKVVTAGWDSHAQVWDATSGRPTTPPLQHEAGVNQATFSPDGRLVLTASLDDTARVWNATTGERIHTLQHQLEVASAAFSGDGRYIATGCSDKTARIWETATGKPVGSPFQHREWVEQVVFSPSGRQLLTSGLLQAVLWNLETGLAVQTFEHHGRAGGFPQFPLFSPDGRYLITASRRNSAQVYDAATGEAVTAALPSNGRIAHAAFSPYSSRIVVAPRESLGRVWEFGVPSAPAGTSRSLVNRVAFSADGQRLVTACFDGTARVWDAATGEPRCPPMKHREGVAHAAFSSDGRFVVTASYDRTARVWDANTGEPITAPLRHRSGVLAAEFSPTGRRILTATEHGAWA